MTYQKQLRLNCEWLFSFVIRGRDRFICQLYGRDRIQCSGNLQAAHIVTRGVKGIKYDLRNAKCLCASHHKYYTHRPHEWDLIVMKLWPDAWEYLTQKKWQRLSTEIDKEGVFVELMLEAKKYENDFPEYIPKIRAIEAWISTVAEGKTK